MSNIKSPAVIMGSKEIEPIIRLANRGDTYFARLAIKIFIAKVEAGQDVPDILQNYIAARLGYVLKGKDKNSAQSLGLVPKKRGPNAGKVFKPFKREYWLACCVKTLRIRISYNEAVNEVAKIADCSDSTVIRACRRFKDQSVDAISSDGRLPEEIISRISKKPKLLFRKD